MTSENPIKQNESTQNATDKHSSVESSVSAVVSPKMERPPAHPCDKISCDNKRDGWDYAKIIAEFIGLGFLIAYTVYTAGIYCANRKAASAAHDTLGEIQKQTTLMRQETVGTYEAVIPQEGPGPQTITNDLQLFRYQGLNVSLRNVGKIKAKNIAIDITMTRQHLPNYSPIGRPQRRQVTRPELRPYEQNGPHGTADAINVAFDTNMFTDNDLTRLQALGK